MLSLYLQYLCNGVLNDLADVARTYYLIEDCALSVETLTTADAVLQLPWLFNLAFVYGSDRFAHRRRAWVYAACAVGFVAWAGVVLAPCSRVSLVLLFLAECGVACWSIALDAMLMTHKNVERIQYTCMSCALVGKTLGAVAGGVLRGATHSVFVVFAVQCGAFGLVLVLIGSVFDFGEAEAARESQQEPWPPLWPLVRHPGFLALLAFNGLPVARMAVVYFLIAVLEYSPTDIGLLDAVGNVASAGAFMLFDAVLKRMREAELFVVVWALNALLLLVLTWFVQRRTLEVGVPDALGVLALPCLTAVAALAYAPYQAFVVVHMAGTRHMRGFRFSLLSVLPFLSKLVSAPVSVALVDLLDITKGDVHRTDELVMWVLWSSLPLGLVVGAWYIWDAVIVCTC